MLLNGAMNRLLHVWHKTIQWLSDGILREQCILAHNQGMLYNYLKSFLQKC